MGFFFAFSRLIAEVACFLKDENDFQASGSPPTSRGNVFGAGVALFSRQITSKTEVFLWIFQR
jgi:hypothetical protein